MFYAYEGYGDQYSDNSPWNEYSSSDAVPVLLDEDGDFWGYFTINEYRPDAVEFAADMKEWFEDSDGDLEEVRVNLCEAFGYDQ